jgi:acyl carrier protein
MNEQAIQERVREVMAGLFLVHTTDIGPDSSIKTIEQWDSLRHVQLMMAIEEEFGIRIDLMDAAEMVSFPAVCEALKRYLGD